MCREAEATRPRPAPLLDLGTSRPIADGTEGRARVGVSIACSLLRCVTHWLSGMGPRRTVLVSALVAFNLLAASVVYAHRGRGLGIWLSFLLFQSVVAIRACSRDAGGYHWLPPLLFHWRAFRFCR
jgi:hypothetical protein